MAHNNNILNQNNLNLHIMLNTCTYASRFLKESKSLVVSGCCSEVIVAALWETGLKKQERIDEKRRVWRIRLRTRNLPKNLIVQAIKYFEWIARMMAGMRSKIIGVVHSHSLATLPAGVIFKYIWDAKLVYDTHELETERDWCIGIRGRLSKLVERFFIRFADAVIVVSDHIAEWYVENYGISRPVVVKNVPVKELQKIKGSKILKDKFRIPENEILFIYQGGMAPGRGIERLLQIFAQSNRNRHIVFMGYGSLEEVVKKHTHMFPNIHFQPAVSLEKVLQYTSSADVGFCLTENTCLNHYYSLPNKFFEYIMSGLPVMINDFPEQRKIVMQYGCGWIAPETDKSAVKMINALEHREIKVKAKHSKNASRYMGWHVEAQKLLEVYKSLLEKNA